MKNKDKHSFKIIWCLSVFVVTVFSLYLNFDGVGISFAKENKNENVNSNKNSSEENSNLNSSPVNSQSSQSQNSVRYEDIEKDLEQKRADLDKIESKIRTYEKLVEIKQKEQKTLENQINVIDNQVEITKEEIQKAEKNIEKTTLEIQALDLNINEKNELILDKQSALKVLLNDLHRKDKKDMLEILLSYAGLSFFIQEIAYSEQTNQQVFNKLEEINAVKKELEAKHEEVKKKQAQLEETRKNKMEKTFYLEGEQNSKEKLLTETEGEESRYQELLKRVEAQKQELLGDIDELSASKASEFNYVQSHQKKPTSGLASNDWYFSQRDSRWGSSDIGHSNTKMSKYGCAVTCVSMVLRYHGVSIDPGILARQPIFTSDLIVWPDQWQFVKRSGGFSHGNINWDTIDDEIAKRNPVIVFVRANGRGAGHYVVIHHKDNDGKYVVHDPMWGPNIFLTSTKENIGVLYGSGTSIDQMIIYHNTKRVSDTPTPVSEHEKNPSPKETKENKNSNGNTNANKKNSNKSS